MSDLYTSVSKNYIQRNGFVIISNLIMEFQHELGINDLELAFLIKVMKNRPGFALHDRDLDPTVSSKTLSRRRNALKEKGLLNFSTIKKQDPDSGLFATYGISYDLSPLEEKLQTISDEIENKKQKEAQKIIKEEHLIIDPEDEPLEKYKQDWENYYGRSYRLTSEEINAYNKLSKKEKECIGKIFDYFEVKGLFGKYVPRLNLFLKVKFRFNDLFAFCEENYYEEPEETQFEKDLRICNTYSEEYFKKYYEEEHQNYKLMGRIRRIVNKNYKNGILDREATAKEVDEVYHKILNGEL